MDDYATVVGVSGLVFAILGALAGIGPFLDLWVLLQLGAGQSSQGDVPKDVIRSMVSVLVVAMIPGWMSWLTTDH